MAITRISPISGKAGDLASVNARRASRRWLVQTNSRYDDEFAVLNAGINGGVFPTPFLSFHPTWLGLLCRSLRADQDEGAPLKWIVVAEYSSEPLSNAERQGQFIPPLDRPAVIRQRKNQYSKPQAKDVNGKPYTNSANDPTDPPIELPRGYPVFIITKNVAAVPAGLLQYGDAINAAPFFIEDVFVDTYQARIDDWERSALTSEIDSTGNEWQYFVFTWSIELNQQDTIGQNVDGAPPGAPSGWLVQYLDAGYRCFRSGGGTLKKYNILDDSTPPQPITSVALLNGGGGQLASGSDPYYRIRHGYYEVDFNLFPLS
jgi:hypothetical protein